MLSRLWQWVRPSAPRASVANRSSAVQPIAGLASTPRIASTPREREEWSASTPRLAEPSFFEQLASELPPIEDVSAQDEPAIAQLVMQVVAYVTQKKLDPPVVPALVPRVLDIVGEPEVDLTRLTHVIQQDLAISAKLLSVANSPMFGSGSEVKTVRQAIAHLGSEQVAQVAIGLACRSNMDSGKGVPPAIAARWQRLFQHGMTCALAAAQLAGKQDRAAQEAAFLGGLFHDVGKAVSLRAIEALSLAGALAPVTERVMDEALQRIHAYPGDEFYQKWTLPEPLMQLCARHHQLDDLEQMPATFYLVTLVSSFDSLLVGGEASRREALQEARISAERLGMTEQALSDAYRETRSLGEKAMRMFGS
jgi:putative nucleotidyltransferase with HDIG domain